MEAKVSFLLSSAGQKDALAKGQPTSTICTELSGTKVCILLTGHPGKHRFVQIKPALKPKGRA